MAAAGHEQSAAAARSKRGARAAQTDTHGSGTSAAPIHVPRAFRLVTEARSSERLIAPCHRGPAGPHPQPRPRTSVTHCTCTHGHVKSRSTFHGAGRD
eukprot:4131771-Prymnesium_polylepis.1